MPGFYAAMEEKNFCRVYAIVRSAIWATGRMLNGNLYRGYPSGMKGNQNNVFFSYCKFYCRCFVDYPGRGNRQNDKIKDAYSICDDSAFVWCAAACRGCALAVI